MKILKIAIIAIAALFGGGYAYSRSNLDQERDNAPVQQETIDSATASDPTMDRDAAADFHYEETDGEAVSVKNAEADGESSVDWGYILLGVLCLIFLALTVVLFMQVQSLKKRDAGQLSRIRELDNKMDKLNSRIREYREKYEASDRRVRELRERERSRVAKPDTKRPVAAVEEEGVHKEPSYPHTLFVGIPDYGMFGHGSEKDIPGKTLYRIELISETTGRFSFIETEMNFRLARTNVTQFVERACEISEGEDLKNFRSIMTVAPGEVARTENGWKITKKAVVRFI